MIKISNITKKYGDYTAVNNLSLQIDKGEIVGLLGPNGAGKSTTMKIITGYMYANSGEVEVDGLKYPQDEIEIKKLIGYMPENNPLYKEMKVIESLKFAASLNNVVNIDERIKFVVKATDLSSVMNKSINELSKGFKQRVGLALALIHDPKILILDEPTEGLDPNQRNEIRKLIKDLGKERTVIISTHVLQEVEAMCNRIVIINKGNVVLDDSKEKILKRAGSNNEYHITFKKISKDFDDFQKDKSIQVISNEEVNGITKMQIVTSNSESFLGSMNSYIKLGKIEIQELHHKPTNLEEIFRQLTVN